MIPIVKMELFLIALALISCNKEKVADNFHASENYNRTIKITAHYIYGDSLLIDSLVPQVIVKIYDTEFNFLNDIYPDATRTTDSNGLALFEERDKDFYWIRAFKDSMGTITDSVSTPANTISFVSLYFY